MARKKRSIVTTVAPEAEAKSKQRFQDAFQQNVGKKVEEVGKKFEGHQKNILYAVGGLVLLLIVAGVFYSWNARSKAAGQAALAKAIETYEAVVTNAPVPVASTVKQFQSTRDRAEAAILEFRSVAEQYGGDVGQKAAYYAAVSRMSFDREGAVPELEAIAATGSDAGKLAKFAIAQVRAEEGRPEDAINIYKELAAMPDPIVSKDTIDLELAKLYEKQGNKQEAVNILFEMVKAASEAKDLEGNPAITGAAVQTAKTKLKELDPEKAKQIPEPEIALPTL